MKFNSFRKLGTKILDRIIDGKPIFSGERKPKKRKLKSTELQTPNVNRRTVLAGGGAILVAPNDAISKTGEVAKTVVQDNLQEVLKQGGVVLTERMKKLLPDYKNVVYTLERVLNLDMESLGRTFEFGGTKLSKRAIFEKRRIRDEDGRISFSLFRYLSELADLQRVKGYTFKELSELEDLIKIKEYGLVKDVPVLLSNYDREIHNDPIYDSKKKLKRALNRDPKALGELNKSLKEIAGYLGLKQEDDVGEIYNILKERVIFYTKDALEDPVQTLYGFNPYALILNCILTYDIKPTDPLFKQVEAKKAEYDKFEQESYDKRREEMNKEFEKSAKERAEREQKQLESRENIRAEVRYLVTDFSGSEPKYIFQIKSLGRMTGMNNLSKMHFMHLFESEGFRKFAEEAEFNRQFGDSRVVDITVMPTGYIDNPHYGKEVLLSTSDPRVYSYLMLYDRDENMTNIANNKTRQYLKIPNRLEHSKLTPDYKNEKSGEKRIYTPDNLPV